MITYRDNNLSKGNLCHRNDRTVVYLILNRCSFYHKMGNFILQECFVYWLLGILQAKSYSNCNSSRKRWTHMIDSHIFSPSQVKLHGKYSKIIPNIPPLKCSSSSKQFIASPVNYKEKIIPFIKCQKENYHHYPFIGTIVLIFYSRILLYTSTFTIRRNSSQKIRCGIVR